MKLILASEKDPAAMNIVSRLLELYDHERTTDERHFQMGEDLSMEVIKEESTEITALSQQADEVIVASRHASDSGRPSLTVHAPGFLERGELALASPRTIKLALAALKAEVESLGLQFEVSLEATHHGPAGLGVPVTFVEIGSGPEQWADRRAGEAVAHAIMKAATSDVKCLNAAGLGGPHYAPRHTEVTLNTEVGVGHILPKYVNFDAGLVELAVRRTSGGVNLLLLDWKGLSEPQRKVCLRAAEVLGIRVERAGEIARRKKL
ncbi:MAG: D-aminoacyl-tRNA deacylase [Candidatus Hadarchaeum sp.]|uniref:D-aminoacyl-tRNA deacylase n=1 Tax=Candidatus Hadarchaeum sp. TaxID=2883567 RepID=UPI003D0BED2D